MIYAIIRSKSKNITEIDIIDESIRENDDVAAVKEIKASGKTK